MRDNISPNSLFYRFSPPSQGPERIKTFSNENQVGACLDSASITEPKAGAIS